MNKRYKSKRAIAMIELIFALVVMGIVMMSAPMMISQASSTGITLAHQEAIAALASDVSMIMTQQWDEQDTSDSEHNPILVTNGDIALNEALYPDGNPSGRRAGTPLLSTRNFLTSLGGRLAATPPAALGPDPANDGGVNDDIDDYNGQARALVFVGAAATTADVGDYMDTSLRLTSQIQYISDTPTAGGYNQQNMNLDTPFAAAAAGTTNIKMITDRAASQNNANVLNTDIVLRAFSCNIGTYELEWRQF